MWLLVVWLWVADSAPTREDHRAVVRDFYGVGDAAGTLGLALATSVIAYLMGSLIHELARPVGLRLLSRVRGLFAVDDDEANGLGLGEGPLSEGEVFERIQDDRDARDARLIRGGVFARSDELTVLRLHQLTTDELDGAHSRVWDGLFLLSHRDNALLTVTGLISENRERSGWSFTVVQLDSDEDIATVDMPRLPAARDIFLEFDLIFSRLEEQSPVLASKVGRLWAEARFRFHLIPPLTALIITVAAKYTPLTLTALVAPAALLLQALAERRDGDRELVDAMRTRQGTPALERLTPTFRIQRERTDESAAALQAVADGFAKGEPRTAS
jgi:hypothetical protein